MEPGEYMTNVLSLNELPSIAYEYYEYPRTTPSLTRRQLQNAEASWRREGALVFCDQFQDRIWLFRPDAGTNAIISAPQDLLGVDILLKQKGFYEAANLERNKPMIANSSSTPIRGSSPSTGLENSFRNAQNLNARAVQANLAQNVAHESPTQSPNVKQLSGATDVSPPTEEIHENFISAVLGSVTYILCHDHGFVPLNTRTLVFNSLRATSSTNLGTDTLLPKNTLTLATLDISLTSLGTLVFKASTDSAPGLQSCHDSLIQGPASARLAPGTALWLAPTGSPAKFHAPEESQMPEYQENGDLQTSPHKESEGGPKGLVSRMRPWKSRCLEWLSNKGFDPALIDQGGWILVQTIKSNPSRSNVGQVDMPEEAILVPWPALLCFRLSTVPSRDMQHSESLLDGWRDPLLFAEKWYVSNDDRTNIMLKWQKERQAIETSSKAQSDVQAHVPKSNVLSASALRRDSNAGSMYPTPPDALQHHNNVGVTPSFEGAGSTPGNVQALAQEVEAPPGTNPSSGETELWPLSDSKTRTNSNINLNGNDNDNDNLFGDIGTDLFGDTDITDADFSFFDQPDALKADPRSSPPLTTLSSVSVAAIQNKEDHKADETARQSSSHADVEMKDPHQLAIVDSPLEHVEMAMDQEIKHNFPGVNSGKDKGTLDRSLPVLSLPFNKEAIFNQLFKEELGKSRNTQGRSSVFEKIDFHHALDSVNEKYGAHGRFNYSPGKRSLQKQGNSSLPTTTYMKLRLRSRNRQPQVDGMGPTGQNSPTLHIANKEDVDLQSDSDATSLASDLASELHDLSPGTQSPFIVLIPGVKRKRAMEGEMGDEIVSNVDELDHSAVQSPEDSQLPILEADPAAWSLAPHFTTAEPGYKSIVLSDFEYIATAQILADQAVANTLQLPGSMTTSGHGRANNVSVDRELMHKLSKAAGACLKGATTCKMRSFLGIQGIPVLNQALRLPPSPVSHPRGLSLDTMKSNNPFPLPAPKVDVRRSESKLSVLPSAMPFWDNLGLGPSEGSKDVSAVCVYPNLEGAAERASTFLEQMRSVYESYRFGSHEKALSEQLPDSLLPYLLDLTHQASHTHHLTMLKETIARLSNILLSLSLEKRNIVVYFVYPVGDAMLLVHICCAFKHLFDLYRKGLSERRMYTSNELVLQLVPLNFIASSTSLIIPSPSEYARLAMEVYDRCVEFTSSRSTPAILLEQTLPRTIDFKLTSQPSVSLLQENSCLHVAYSQSIDDRWITAAWTDNRGSQQMTSSYCLGRRNEPVSTPFYDVANEIWQTTLDIIKMKVHWRIFIVKIGAMETFELDIWKSFPTPDSHPPVNLTLVTVQTSPSFRLLPDPVTLSPSATNINQVLTPVSTPQTAVPPSAFPMDNVSTPTRDMIPGTPIDAPAEMDTDARLIDFTDQSWGAILSHRLNNSNSLLEIRPALISGYLIKRGGVDHEDPPIVLEVNIIHSEVVGNPRTFHEGLLRELLGYYRGLATLARVRGVVDAVKDGRPWHIAAAEKAVNALYILM